MNYSNPTLALLSVFFMLFDFNHASQNQDSINPLPDCPTSPNCATAELTFNADSSTVLNAAHIVLKEMNAQTIEWIADSTQIQAVFKIPVFGYLDDVHVAAVPTGSETKLFVRSASREGYWDILVNTRRVKKFTKHIKKHLSN